MSVFSPASQASPAGRVGSSPAYTRPCIGGCLQASGLRLPPTCHPRKVEGSYLLCVPAGASLPSLRGRLTVTGARAGNTSCTQPRPSLPAVYPWKPMPTPLAVRLGQLSLLCMGLPGTLLLWCLNEEIGALVYMSRVGMASTIGPLGPDP